MTDPLLQSVRSFLARPGMVSPGSTVVVAVSGGQDSCALLHALSSLQHAYSLALHVAHLNHGFRMEDAAADAQFVRAFADRLAIPCTVAHSDVPRMASRLHLSAQEAARRARHRFLEHVADTIGAQRIALGHTSDDHVETILMNIFRGTGIDGLAGLTPVRGRCIRPLLSVSRDQTAAYCGRHGIAFRDDASNGSLRYTRNRIRSELLPQLESYYYPEVRRALARLGALAADDSAALNAWANEMLDRALVNTGTTEIVLSVEGVRGLPLALQRRIVRVAITRARGSLHDIDCAMIERVVEAIRDSSQSGRRFQLTLPSGDNYIEVTRDTMCIGRQTPWHGPCPFERTLPVPGEARLAGGAVIAASYVRPPDALHTERGADRAYVNVAAVRPPLVVRSRRSGDRIQPFGMAATRKVQDVLTDRKVPAALRDAVPIVADAGGILWIARHCLSERARMGPDAETALLLELRE